MRDLAGVKNSTHGFHDVYDFPRKDLDRYTHARKLVAARLRQFGFVEFHAHLEMGLHYLDILHRFVREEERGKDREGRREREREGERDGEERGRDRKRVNTCMMILSLSTSENASSNTSVCSTLVLMLSILAMTSRVSF